MSSLALCCTNPPVEQAHNVIPRPGARALTVNWKREPPAVLRISPWMFRPEQVTASVPYRAVPVRNYESTDEFREVYSGARHDEMRVELRPGQ